MKLFHQRVELDEIHEYVNDLVKLANLRDHARDIGETEEAEQFYNTIEIANLVLQRLLENVA